VLHLGLLLTSVHDVSVPPEVQVREHRELIRAARELGFDLVVAGQHFAGPALRYLQPIPYLASLAAEAAPMRIATGIILVPLHHPVALAEEIATLDVVSEGRLVFGVGIGYAPKEFEVFGIDRRTRTRRFEESLEVIRRLWTGEAVDHNGEFFQLDDVRTSTLPVQRPGPPIWIGAQAEASVRRAARIGDAWYCPPFPTHDEFLALRRSYDEECESLGRPVPTTFAARRELFVASSEAEARRMVDAGARSRYATYASWGLDVGDGLDGDWRRTRFVLGDGAQVAERLRWLIDEARVTELVIKPQWPGLEHRDAMQQLERFGTEVLPLLTAGAA
jgi:probable F420-dependent oxidoreductase